MITGITGATGQLGRLVVAELKKKIPDEQAIALVIAAESGGYGGNRATG